MSHSKLTEERTEARRARLAEKEARKPLSRGAKIAIGVAAALLTALYIRIHSPIRLMRRDEA